MKYIMKGIPLWQIRNWSLEAYGADSQKWKVFFRAAYKSFDIRSICSDIFPICSILFSKSQKDKYRKGLLILSLIYLILSSLSSGGGRLAIVCYVFYFLLAYITFAKKVS